ncbi:hypothetical protein T4A_7348 [Trichinella pseudospiralis]|uniref:Uncharacterized protein n=1 Tax=Trichinella pseudospiralis TaxID=6337 RepID=A0A0V1DQ94_TRIPS|nr:hypothetical protein T4A_7348 [Trichinella pseudospiralis]
MVVRILPLRVWYTQFAMECVAMSQIINIYYSIFSPGRS